MIEIELPMSKQTRLSLHAGDVVSLSGIIYTARDAAHKRLCEMMAAGETLPFELKDAVIYYCGPCPASEGKVIGSCGPTTSGRMDAYAPMLYENGAAGAIGKGVIGDNVKAEMKRYAGVYFLATGGAGALISKCVQSCETVAFEDLGAEAIRKLYVKDVPLVVGCDCFGADVYKM